MPALLEASNTRVAAAHNDVVAGPPAPRLGSLWSGEVASGTYRRLPHQASAFALFQRFDLSEADTADMSEWPPELDQEARAIHADFKDASFRTLVGD
jgi:hypothetical protein